MNRKQIVPIAVMLLCSLEMTGQEPYPVCDTRYFGGNRYVSTSICYDKDQRKGVAKAYDLHGKKIYEKEVRRIYGTASVTFSYYENGAVREARYHSAPDAGIQWYNTDTHFAPDGTITAEEHNDYDMLNHLRAPEREAPAIKENKKSETAYCAFPFTTEYWYVNCTRYPVIAVAQRKGNSRDLKATVLQPSDSAKGGEVIVVQQFVDPADYYDYSVLAAPGHPKRKFRITQSPDYTNKEKMSRRYYYLIR